MGFMDGFNGFNDACKYDAATEYGRSCRPKRGEGGNTGGGGGSSGCAMVLLVAWGIASAIGWASNQGPSMQEVLIMLAVGVVVIGGIVLGWFITLEVKDPDYTSNPARTRRSINRCAITVMLFAIGAMAWWFAPWLSQLLQL